MENGVCTATRCGFGADQHSAFASSQAHISRRRKMIALYALLPASPRHCQVARKECKANQSDRRIATACWTRIRQRHSHSLAAERDSGRCCMCGVPCRRISDAFVRLRLKHCGTGRGLSHGGARHLRRQKTASAKRPVEDRLPQFHGWGDEIVRASCLSFRRLSVSSPGRACPKRS